jgi:hypothetical protein
MGSETGENTTRSLTTAKVEVDNSQKQSMTKTFKHCKSRILISVKKSGTNQPLNLRKVYRYKNTELLKQYYI